MYLPILLLLAEVPNLQDQIGFQVAKVTGMVIAIAKGGELLVDFYRAKKKDAVSADDSLHGRMQKFMESQESRVANYEAALSRLDREHQDCEDRYDKLLEEVRKLRRDIANGNNPPKS